MIKTPKKRTITPKTQVFISDKVKQQKKNHLFTSLIFFFLKETLLFFFKDCRETL